MMAQILEQMLQSMISLEECNKQLKILQAQDNDGKTAIQIALEYGTLFMNVKDFYNYAGEIIDLLTQRICRNIIANWRTVNLLLFSQKYYTSVCVSLFYLLSLCTNLDFCRVKNQ